MYPNLFANWKKKWIRESITAVIDSQLRINGKELTLKYLLESVDYKTDWTTHPVARECAELQMVRVLDLMVQK